MSDPIGPGDYVEFVGPRRIPFLMPPVGSVHVVSEIQSYETACPGCSATSALRTIRWPVFICETYWRPIYRPKPDAFADLLKIPELETQS